MISAIIVASIVNKPVVGLVILGFVYFLFVVVWLSLVSASAIDCLEKLVFQMTYYAFGSRSEYIM